MKVKNRSPLKSKPLHVAGQSLDLKIIDFLDDHMVAPVMLVTCLWVLAGQEWYRYFVPHEPHPGFYTIVAGGTTTYAAWRLRHVLTKLRALKLGRDGERAVGEFLERLREKEYRIFHDIPGDKFNLDHVVIGAKGVFLIETKTVSKPRHGEARVTFDGERIRLQNMKPERDPVIQARALARWLRDVLHESTGRKVMVRPIVTYPGWFVEGPSNEARSDVWVLNPRAIPSFIEHERDVLLPEDVKLLSYHLSRYVRAENSR